MDHTHRTRTRTRSGSGRTSEIAAAVAAGARAYRRSPGGAALHRPDGTCALALPDPLTAEGRWLARIAIEAVALADFEQLKGQVVRATRLFVGDGPVGPFIDERSGIPVRVKPFTRAGAILNWDGEWLDSAWEVDLQGRHPRIQGRPVLWVAARSYCTDGAMRAADLFSAPILLR